MYDYICSTINSSTRIGVSGASPHSDIVKISPVESKIFLFTLCIQLTECCIVNSIVSLAMTFCMFVNTV